MPATAAVFDVAAELAPTDLRTLDAVHLATALGIIDDCDGIITYDDRLAHVARQHGFTVVAPR